MANKINFDRCREAVSKLANVGSSAVTIISEAKTICSKPIIRPIWDAPKIKLIWDPVAEDNGWLIEQNMWFKQVRLVDPMRKIHATIFFDDKLDEFLSNIITICKGQVKINDCLSDMALDKDHEFIFLVGRMGARHTYTVSIDNKSSGFGFNGAGNRGDNSPVGSFRVGVNTNFKGYLKKFEKYDVYYEDDMANFSDDLLINSKWFQNDKQMNLIFTSRKEGNLTSMEYESILSDSSNIDFSVEARNIGVDEARLKGAFEKLNGVYRKFIIDFKKNSLGSTEV